MNKYGSLLYLLLTFWWLFTHIRRFPFEKKLSFLISIIALVSLVFNAASEVNLQFELVNYESLGIIYWASLHLFMASLSGLLIINISQVPPEKGRSVVFKILLVAFLVGMTRYLLAFQNYIALVLVAMVLIQGIYSRKQFQLTFDPFLKGSLLILLFLSLKVFAIEAVLLNIFAMMYFTIVIQHFVLRSIGEERFV